MTKKIIHLIGNRKPNSDIPTATEYIKPHGKINITSHGLGSGIYGISKRKAQSKKFKKLLPEWLDKGFYVELKLSKPLIISSDKNCNQLIAWSTTMNDILEERKNQNDLNNHMLKSLTLVFSDKKLLPQSIKHLSRARLSAALKKFIKDYFSRKNIVKMPINYVLESMGYDGIYTRNSNCDGMSKGNVKFVTYPEKTDTLNITGFKTRHGTDKELHIPENFKRVGKLLLRHPSLSVTDPVLRYKNYIKYQKWLEMHNIPKPFGLEIAIYEELWRQQT